MSADPETTAGAGASRVVLQARAVTKRYVLDEVEVNALRGVDLDVHEGEMLAIMGPSGSGKSTLMHIVGLLDLPSTGTVTIDGVDVSRMQPNQLAAVRNKRIGFVFQAFNLLPRTSALSNVELPLIYAGVSMLRRSQVATTALERVGLGNRLGHFSSQLSGGQQQRVAIARALVTEPSIVLADEPTGNLDSKSGVEVMTILQDLNRQGITVVLVTHDANVARHAQRVVHIRDGAIVADERVAERIDARSELAALQGESGGSTASAVPSVNGGSR